MRSRDSSLMVRRCEPSKEKVCTRRFPRSATTRRGSVPRVSTKRPCGVSNSPSPWPGRPTSPINGSSCIGRVFTRVAVCPKRLAVQRGLHDLALIDIAVIENFRAFFAADTKPMRAPTKFLPKGTDEAPGGVVNNHGLSAHAGFVHRVRHIDVALLILRQTVGVPPNQAVGRHQPVVNTLVGVHSRADNRQAAA